jgi:DNA-binding GntR family transcriptional regulator
MADLALGVIPRSSLAKETSNRLRRAILSGELAEGTPLPEAATAAKLGVSRVPVREALVELDREGLVEFDSNGRACVRAFTPDDLLEILTLRAALQSMAARMACKKLTPDDLRRLEAIYATTHDAKDLTEFSSLDTAFHDEIVVIARHRRLSRLWTELRSQMELWLARLHRRREDRMHDVREATYRSHREFIEVLKSGRPEEAARMMERHCGGWEDMLPELLDATGKRA